MVSSSWHNSPAAVKIYRNEVYRTVAQQNIIAVVKDAKDVENLRRYSDMSIRIDDKLVEHLSTLSRLTVGNKKVENDLQR